MAKVQISDVIEPSVFTPYMLERSTELSRLFQSGLISTDAMIQEYAQGGGTRIKMPFWNDLTGDSEGLSDSSSLTPAKIDANQDEAVKHYRGKAWSANDLAGAVAGDDPMARIADRVASYWNRDMQSVVLLNTLSGVFGSALSSSHVLDNSTEDFDGSGSDANLIGSEAILDAVHLLGDHWTDVTAMSMHSVVFKRLQKLNLIEFEPLSEQGIQIPRFMGREVIVDDGMPTEAGTTSGTKYTTYLFGEGAVGMADAGPDDPNEATETDRDSLAGDDILISRRHFVLHPRGVAFTGSVSGATPTTSELSDSSNWTKRWDDKNIRTVKLVTNG